MASKGEWQVQPHTQERLTVGVMVVRDKQGGEMELPEGRLSGRGSLKAESKAAHA